MKNEYCQMCGRRMAECEHHLIFGNGYRRLSDEDDLTILLCNDCHNMAEKISGRIHGNSAAERLSKMLGQMQWERDHITTEAQRKAARQAFIDRYGRSWL